LSDDLPAHEPASRFSIEGRPAAGLYLAGWLLSGLGLVTILLGIFAGVPLTLAGLPVLALGLAATAGYQVIARRADPRAAYRGPSPLLIFGLAFFTALIGLIALVVLGVDPETPWGALAAIATQVAGYAVVGWLAVIRTNSLSWREIALPPGAMAGMAQSVGSALAVMLPVTLLALVLAGLIAGLLDVGAPEVLPPARSASELIAIVLAGVILAPVGEEFLFRGIAVSAWLRDLGPRSAILRATVLFAAVHVLNVNTPDPSTGVRQTILVLAVILPVGYALGWLYLRRGLAASITGHMVYNGVLLGLTVLVEQLPPPA
jgi:membrane protease YdiL (CAAX protease family)